MDDLTDVKAQGEAAPEEGAPSTSTEAPDTEVKTTEENSGGNPAWEDIRKKLDPLLFKSIEENLKEFDKNAQSRIESLNKQYEPYKPFAEQGLGQQQIAQAVQLAQMIDQNPEEIYQKLGEFLKQNGKLPETQKEVKDALDGNDEDEGDEPVDPRIAQLEESQKQMEAFIKAQAEEKASKEADAALESEISALRKAKPEMSDEDLEEVINRAATIGFLNHQKGLNKVPKLAEVYEEVVKYRNSILQAPRPGDSAPRLLPTSGGALSSATGEKKSLGQLSSNETIDLLSGLLQGGNG